MVIALRRAFVAASLIWTAALPLATWCASRPHAPLPSYAFALSVYGIGSLICHQRPERSFWMWSAQLPVCARCVGIYLGAAVVGVASVAVGGSGLQRFSRAGHDTRRLRALVVAAALPTAATLLFEWTTGRTPSNPVRAFAGFPLGAVVAWIVARSG